MDENLYLENIEELVVETGAVSWGVIPSIEYSEPPFLTTDKEAWNQFQNVIVHISKCICL